MYGHNAADTTVRLAILYYGDHYTTTETTSANPVNSNFVCPTFTHNIIIIIILPTSRVDFTTSCRFIRRFLHYNKHWISIPLENPAKLHNISAISSRSYRIFTSSARAFRWFLHANNRYLRLLTLPMWRVSIKLWLVQYWTAFFSYLIILVDDDIITISL